MRSGGLAASLRPDGFVSGAASFVRRTLARSVFLGFRIESPKVRKYEKRRAKLGNHVRRIWVSVDLFLLNLELTGGKRRSIWNLYSAYKPWNSRAERHVHLKFLLSENIYPIWKLHYHPGIHAWRIQVHLERLFSAWNSRPENGVPCRASMLALKFTAGENRSI